MENTLTSEKSVEHPSTCLCGRCLARAFDAASWRERDRIARKIISARSREDLCRITPESRHFLREVLSLGYAPRTDKEALAKLLTAELLSIIPTDRLAAIEYQSGCIIKGARDFIEKLKSQLDSIAMIPIGERLLQSLARS